MKRPAVTGAVKNPLSLVFTASNARIASFEGKGTKLEQCKKSLFCLQEQ